MAGIRDLRNSLEKFERTPQARSLDLRLTLSTLILNGLDRRRWTQKRLAAEAGMRESFVSRLIHAQSNCEFDTVGRILHALGTQAALVEKPLKPARRMGQTATSKQPHSRRLSSRGR